MLGKITPVLLVYNEEANLGRTLQRLDWAQDVLVVDSGSLDSTLEIAASFSNTRVLTRLFDDFASQWNFALDEGDIRTEWVLALDADYVVTDELIEEVGELSPQPDVAGYRVEFSYLVRGRPLRRSLYPPAIVLFRKEGASYALDGHAHRLVPAPGRIVDLRSSVRHDDRKPFSRWLESQRRYAREEAWKLRSASWSSLGWPDRARKAFLAPLLVLPYTLLVRGCILDGLPGLEYAFQRTLAEMQLSLALLRSEGR